MIEGVHDWLPVEALAAEPVRTRLSSAVEGWSGDWFGRLRTTLASLEPLEAEDFKRCVGDWRPLGRTSRMECAPSIAHRLAAWALDAEPHLNGTRALDLRLMQIFGDQMLGDLAERVEDALGLGDGSYNDSRMDAGPCGGLILGIAGSAGGALLSLAVPAVAAIPYRKAALGARPAPCLAVPSMMDSLGGIQVALEATLGQAEIALEDLTGLRPGDVLILDREIEAPVEFTLAGSAHVLGRGRLSAAEGGLALTLQH